VARLRAPLPEEEMLVAASTVGIRRLLTLLFRVGHRCTGCQEKVGVQVARREGQIEVTMDLPGVRLEGEEGMDGLPPESDGGLHQLEREAGRWLVRQTGGQIETTQGGEGITIKVRWEAK
jgi:hypothetical protein